MKREDKVTTINYFRKINIKPNEIIDFIILRENIE